MIVFLEDFSQIGFGGGQRFTLAIINCIKQQTSRIQIFHLGSNHLFTQRLSADKTSANNIFFNCVSPESHLFGRLYFILACKTISHKTTTISCTKFTTLVLAFLVQFLPSNSQNNIYCFIIWFHHHIHCLGLFTFRYFKGQISPIFPSKYLNRFRTSFPILHKISVSPLQR